MGRTGSAGWPPCGNGRTDRQTDGWQRTMEHRGTEERTFRLGRRPHPPSHSSPAGSLTPRDGEIAPGGRVPALGHREADGPVGCSGSHRRSCRGPRRAPPTPPPHPVWDTISRSTRTASSLLMFSKLMSFTCGVTGSAWWLGELASRHPQLLPAAPYLQQHVPRLDAPVGRHGPALHDGADVDAAVAPLVALAHNADTQEVVPLCRGEG